MQHRVLLAIILVVAVEANSLPKIPSQFSAEIHITAHLVDPQKEYPPHERRYAVYYDLEKKVARADVLEGYDKGKVFIRRYDEKNEYMIKTGEYKQCQRAYLGEDMPIPEIPSNMQFISIDQIDGKECEHWMHESNKARIHVYQLVDAKVPIRLTEESLWSGEPVPLITYDFKKLVLAPPDPSVFDKFPEGYQHDTCARNIGGFPYIHAFHHYLKF